MRSFRSFWICLLAGLLSFVCVVVFADDAGSEIGKTIDYVWHAVGLIVAGIVTKLLLKLAKKYGIEVNEKQKDALGDSVIDAITYAEEWGRKKLKIDDFTVKSIDKFDTAVEKLCEKVPYLTEAKARELVGTWLPKVRKMIESRIDE